MVRSYFLGLEINCGCFGPGERLGPMTLLRDGSLLALAIAVTVGAFLVHRRNTPQLRTSQRLTGHSVTPACPELRRASRRLF